MKNLTDSSWKRNSFSVAKLAHIFRQLLLFFSLVCLAVVACLALVSTGYFLPEDIGRGLKEVMQFYRVDSQPLHIICSGIGALLIAGILFAIWRISRSTSPLVFAFATCSAALLVQIAWILLLDGKQFVYADSMQLCDASNQLISGNFGAFHSSDQLASKTGPDLYFNQYPFQCGSLLYFSLIFSLFGSNNIIAFQIVNALLNTGIIALLSAIAHFLFDNRRITIITSILSLICIPLLASSTFVYGNCPGLFFSVLSLAFLSRYVSQPHTKWRWLFASFASIGIAVFIKNTCVIFLIAIVVVLVVHSMKEKKLRQLIASLLLAALVSQAPKVGIFVVESEVDADFGDGMPTISWIAMGLRDDNQMGIPGWWSLYPWNVMLEANGDAHAQSEIAADSLRDSLKRFLSDPIYAAYFFSTKLQSEWTDPTFQTLLYSSYSQQSDGSVKYSSPVYSIIYSGSMVNKVSIGYLDAYQSLIYIASIISLILFFRLRTKVSDIVLPTCFFLGFGVYLLWEAKSIYTLPFFVCLLPLAAYGLNYVFEKVDGRMNKKIAGKTKGGKTSKRAKDSDKSNREMHQQKRHTISQIPTLHQQERAYEDTQQSTIERHAHESFPNKTNIQLRFYSTVHKEASNQL